MTYSATYQKRRLLDQSRGIEHTYIDPAPVSEHVRALIAQGMTCRGIGALASVSPSTVIRFRDNCYQHAQRSTAAKILAVRPRLAYRPGHRGLVPAIGARRRIQALLAMGWSHELITAELPDGARSRVILHRGGNSMTTDLHAVIRAVYDRLSMTPGPSVQSRARAARHGYLPPLAWDDDAIDDPEAGPNLGRADDPWSVDDAIVERILAGQSQPTNPREREVIVRELSARGMSDSTIAALCQVWPETILRIRRRLGVGGRYAA